MISAFGVEHGEISKGKVPRLTRAQKRTLGTNPDARSRPQRIADAGKKIARTPVSISGIGSTAGEGMGKVGGFLKERPGLAGTALVGGGSVGGYKLLNRKDKKR